jgi:hypothetical protein
MIGGGLVAFPASLETATFEGAEFDLGDPIAHTAIGNALGLLDFLDFVEELQGLHGLILGDVEIG